MQNSHETLKKFSSKVFLDYISRNIGDTGFPSLSLFFLSFVRDISVTFLRTIQNVPVKTSFSLQSYHLYLMLFIISQFPTQSPADLEGYVGVRVGGQNLGCARAPLYKALDKF